MATSPGARGLLVAAGAAIGGLFGFWLQEKWMEGFRERQREQIQRIIAEESQFYEQEESEDIDEHPRAFNSMTP